MKLNCGVRIFMVEYEKNFALLIDNLDPVKCIIVFEKREIMEFINEIQNKLQIMEELP